MNSCQPLVGDSPEVRRNHYGSTMPKYAKKKNVFQSSGIQRGQKRKLGHAKRKIVWSEIRFL